VSGFSKGIVRGAKDGDENLRLAQFAAEWVNDWDGRAAVIDEHFLAGSMRLAERDPQALFPFQVVAAELRVGVMMLGIIGAVFLPKQLASDALALEFLMDEGEVWQDFWLGGRESQIGKQEASQLGFGDAFRQRPGQLGGLGRRDVFVDYADRQLGRRGNLAL